MRVAVFEVGLPVVAADPRRAAADDHSVAALVEDLGDGGFECVAAAVLVEGDPDVAGGEVGRIALQPPRYAACLVVQRDVQVPRPGGFVLAAAPVRRQFRLVPGAAADDLDGLAQGQRPGLKQGSRVMLFCGQR